MKLCKICGKEFKPKANKQTCSDECSLINQKKTKKAQYKPVEPKLCKMCGKEFKPKGSHKTCSHDCSKERRRETKRRLWKKYKLTDDKYERIIRQRLRRIAEKIRRKHVQADV